MSKDKRSIKTGKTNEPNIPVLNASDIISCTLILPPKEDDQKFRVYIVKIVNDHETKL